MFNKLKQFKDLRSQAKQLQNKLAEETIVVENKGVKITLNGNQEILNVEIDQDWLEREKDKLAETIKNTFNDAVKKVQKVMAQKMMQDGGLKGLGMPF